MFVPTLMLWLYVFAFSAASAMSPDGRLPSGAAYVSSVALALILTSWVTTDAHKRRRRLCYDYDSFVFFTWPIVVPVYLFQTRGVSAFITLLCFAGIWLVAMLAILVAFDIREFLF
jgi:hypothetical protein